MTATTASDWTTLAPALALWTYNRLVNRTDVWGGYGSDGTVTRPSKDKRGVVLLDERRLVEHFRATERNHIVGLHAISPVNLSKWGALDFDNHGGDPAVSERNERAARGWYGELRDFGFRPLLTESNGVGGFHLRIIFHEPVDTLDVFTFVHWLTADFAKFGLTARPECFPKQKAVAPAGQKGQYGNWLRIPGRHHKREHWPRVWDGERWLADRAAIEFILAIDGDDPGLLFSPRLTAYSTKLPNLSEGNGRDDVAWRYAAWLAKDMRLSDEVALHWLNRWDAGNTPPKGIDRLREILKNAHEYGRREYGSGIKRGSAETNGDGKARNDNPSTDSEHPAQRTATEIITAYFRERFKPDFRVRGAVHCEDGAIVSRVEMCDSPDSEIIRRLASATNAPKFPGGGVNEDKLPGLFRKWAKVSFGDLMLSLVDEDAAELGGESVAADEFRRLVSDALLSQLTLGEVQHEGLGTVTQRRSVVEWCRMFAKRGRWAPLRSFHVWFKCTPTEAGKHDDLHVALKHSALAQLGADRQLRNMSGDTFARRCRRYGIGDTSRTERPGGQRCIILERSFIDGLIHAGPEDEPAETTDDGSFPGTEWESPGREGGKVWSTTTS